MKNPLAIRNNNPLNIRFSPMNDWLGQIGCNKGFCVFDTIEHGFRAALVLLCNYHRKGYDTISKIIERWAPRSENNTKAYISAVRVPKPDCVLDPPELHYSPDERLENFHDLCKLLYEMAKVEIGNDWLNHLDPFGDMYNSLFYGYLNACEHYKYPSLKK